jgi:hypothetical protein
MDLDVYGRRHSSGNVPEIVVLLIKEIFPRNAEQDYLN